MHVHPAGDLVHVHPDVEMTTPCTCTFAAAEPGADVTSVAAFVAAEVGLETPFSTD